MKTAAQLVLSLGLCVAACASTSRPALLAALQRDLAAVHAAPATAPFEKQGPQDVGDLRGLTLAEIKSALGEPDCATTSAIRCEEGAAVTYSFYRLPEQYDGGGPTLLIFGDATGRCREARWIVTE